MSRLRKQARGLARLGVTFDVVLTSPFVRTRQTAEIIAAAFDPRPHLATTEALIPDATYAAVLAELAKQARRTRIALVGHEPGIGELAARLVGSRHPIPFKKGAVCCIEVDALPPGGPGALRWFLSPKILRSIKG
jgi:phosphohistidine phosphatase